MIQYGQNITIMVPFRDDYAVGRGANWRWLKAYWEYMLPGAQVVVGSDDGIPFSKTCAVNDAFRKADPANDVLVMLDADCYIAPSVILICAERIREARRQGERMWFVPYRDLYRLTADSTARLIFSDPCHPLYFSAPPNPKDVGSTLGAKLGHRFGALVQIFPREAFLQVGGMDARFRGWGSEDVTFLRVLNTLYCIHETTDNSVFTLWHTSLGQVFERKWAGQTKSRLNASLTNRYYRARHDPARMRKIISEWLDDPAYAAHRITTEVR